MGAAKHGDMDAIFFGLKRACQGALRAGHELTKEYGLTPARFDLLFALKQWRDLHGPTFALSQLGLRIALGVSAPTVSRMLRSLEKLRLVGRGPRKHEYRTTRPVWLTLRGRSLIRRAAKRIVYNKRAQRLSYRALRATREAHERDFVRRESLEEMLRTMRRFFGDVAVLHYAWHADD